MMMHRWQNTTTAYTTRIMSETAHLGAAAVAAEAAPTFRIRTPTCLLASKLRLLCYRSWSLSWSSESCLDDPARRKAALRARAEDPLPIRGVTVPDLAHDRVAADPEPAAAKNPAPTMSSWKTPSPGRGSLVEAGVDRADRDLNQGLPRAGQSRRPDLAAVSHKKLTSLYRANNNTDPARSTNRYMCNVVLLINPCTPILLDQVGWFE